MADVHLYLHWPSADALAAKLDQILAAIQQQGVTMSTELETLTANVKATTDIEQSAITLITGLAAQISAAKTDPAALEALSQQLSTQSAALAAAIQANTQAT